MFGETQSSIERRFPGVNHESLGFAFGAVVGGLEGALIGAAVLKGVDKLTEAFRGKRKSNET